MFVTESLETEALCTKILLSNILQKYFVLEFKKVKKVFDNNFSTKQTLVKTFL